MFNTALDTPTVARRTPRKRGQPMAWFIVSVDKMAGGAFCGDQCTQRVVLGVMDIIGTAGLYEIPGLVIKLP